MRIADGADRRAVTRQFLRWFLPTAALVVACAALTGTLAQRNALADLERPAARVVAQQRAYLEDVLSVPIEHLRSLVELEPRLAAQFDAAAPDLAVVAGEFHTLVSRNRDHFQVRWIDELGRELVRVDQDTAGAIRIRPPAELQDKAGRPYVVRGMGLTRGEIYVSPLDLNVEAGVVDMPYAPTIRFVTRIFDSAGRARGLLVLNSHAKSLLDRFRALGDPDGSALLNSDGYWLSSPIRDEEWGFMVGRDETFAKRHPELWSAMQGHDEGQRIDATGLWTWSRPALLPARVVGDPSLRWVIVDHVPPARVRHACLVVWSAVAGGALVVLVAAALALWRLSVVSFGRLKARNAYRQEAAALAAANGELGRAMAAQLEHDRRLRAALDELSRSKRATEVARAEAEEANRAKSAFLANTSHEIRTPLNAVIGSTYLLGLAPLDGESRQQVETIEAASRALLDLIDDVLDLSKIEAGEMELDPAPFSLIGLLGEMRTLFDVAARQKAIELRFLPVSEDLPDALRGDAHRLRQILANLIANAVKFTERGSITVSVQAVDIPAERRRLRLRFLVADTGIGIAGDRQKRLFVPYAQADRSTSRRYGGTGLGLAIVGHLTSLMAGQAGVDSIEGEGSTFWFEVPLDVIPGQAAHHRAVGAAQPLRVLAASEDATERQVIAAIGRQFGWETGVVAGGQALLDRVLGEDSADRPVDCLMVDLALADVDAFEVVKQVRTRAWDKIVPAVLLVKAVEDPMLRKRDEALLADVALPKPVSAATMFNAVNAASIACGDPAGHVVDRTDLGSGACYWLYGVRVLLVDDNRMNLDVCRKILEHHGAGVTVCESGEGALVLARSAPMGFDVVLMDLQMPGFDGFETARHMRMEPRLAAVPIIALTASTAAGEQSRALVAGMNDFLAKPIVPETLVRAMRLNIERLRKTPLPVVPRPERGASGQESDPPIAVAKA